MRNFFTLFKLFGFAMCVCWCANSEAVAGKLAQSDFGTSARLSLSKVSPRPEGGFRPSGMQKNIRFAQSTINPNIPAQGSALSSQPIRNNFQAAANDINALYGLTTNFVSLNVANLFTAPQTFTNSDLILLGSSLGYTTFTSSNSSATNYVLTIPPVTGTAAVLSGSATAANSVVTTDSLGSLSLTTTLPAGLTIGGSGVATAASVSAMLNTALPNIATTQLYGGSGAAGVAQAFTMGIGVLGNTLGTAAPSTLTTLPAGLGGTGVANNAANTITFTGPYPLGLALSGATALTLPTSGTLLVSPVTNNQLATTPAYTKKCNSTNSAAAPGDCQLEYLHSKDFGALGNNSTDDTVALQAWLNAVSASNGCGFLDPGIYKTSAALNITQSTANNICIDGAGFYNSTISPSNTTQNGLNITSTLSNGGGPFLSNFGIQPSVTPVGGTLLNITGVSSGGIGAIQTKLNLPFLSGGFNALVLTNITQFTTLGGMFTGCLNSCVIINNTGFVGNGDFGFLGTTVVPAPGSIAGIIISAGSGVRLVGGKILGQNASTGILFAPSTSGSYSDVLVSGTSIENVGGPAIKFAKGSATALTNININGDEFSVGGVGGTVIDLSDTNTQWITGVNISGNIIDMLSNNMIGIKFGTSTGGWLVDNNVFKSTTGATGLSGIVTSATAGSGTIGCGNTFLGVATPVTNASGASGCSQFPFNYNSGTWTPVIHGASTAGTFTYTAQVGTWEQIGWQMTVRFTINVSATSVAPVGAITIIGLPVAAANIANDNGVCTLSEIKGVVMDSGYSSLTGLVTPNTSTIQILENAINSTSSAPTQIVGGNVTGSTPILIGYCNYHI